MIVRPAVPMGEIGESGGNGTPAVIPDEAKRKSASQGPESHCSISLWIPAFAGADDNPATSGLGPKSRSLVLTTEADRSGLQA